MKSNPDFKNAADAFATALWGLVCGMFIIDLIGTEIDSGDGPDRLPAVIALVYNLAGYWGIFGVFFVVGLLPLWMGIERFGKDKFLYKSEHRTGALLNMSGALLALTITLLYAWRVGVL